MAKIGMHRVSVVLLAVLAVAVSLQAAHRVSAAGGPTAEAAAAIKSLANFKETVEWVKRITDSGGLVADWVKKGKSSPTLPAGFFHFTVTNIEVDGQSIGSGEAIVSKQAPIAFLDNKAYGLLKDSFPTPTVASKYAADQLCYTGTADQLKTVTLVFTANGDHTRNLWYTQSAESTCLAILPWN